MPALIISSIQADHDFLEEALGGISLKTVRADTYREARELLRQGVAKMVLCERDLPDGSWKDILEELGEKADAPPLIVVSRLADDYLWAEVLNLGGYDVLAKPFDRREVVSVVSAAQESWDNRRLQARWRPQSAATA